MMVGQVVLEPILDSGINGEWDAEVVVCCIKQVKVVVWDTLFQWISEK